MHTLKKNKKMLLCLALVICTIASVFAVTSMPSAAAESTDSIYSFSSTKYYQFEKAFPEFSSYTFETEFYLDPAVVGNGRAYNFIGNWADTGTDKNEWGIELHNYGSVRLFHNTYGSVYFGSNQASNAGTDTDVRKYMKTDAEGNPIYVKMTVTVDTAEGNACLYMDGNKVGEVLGSSILKGKTYTPSTSYTHRIGLDYRDNTSTYFKGLIKNIAMYSYVRSEIQGSGTEFTVDSTDANLMFAYNLDNLKVNGGYLNDLSQNGNNAKNPNWKPDGIGRTFTASDALYLTKDLEVMPQTFEAIVYAPTSIGRPGVIFGNYHGAEAALNFELHTSGNATIHLDPDYDTGAHSTKIADVRNSAGFVHIVIVRNKDTVNGATYSLYVDGEFVKTAQTNVPSKDKVDLDMAEVQKIYKMQLGGDSRGSNAQSFKGRIKNVALYSEPLTAEEVLASYKNGVGTGDESVMLNYDMTTVESDKYVRDLSGNEHHVTENGVPFESFFQGRGFDIDDDLYLEKPLSAQPQTYEAWILAPSAVSRTGVILGNYGSGSKSLINFEIYSNGAPSVYVQNDNGELMDKKFNYSINNDEWSHVVITHEYLSGGARFTCYVNGVQVDSFDTDLSYKISDISTLASLSLGRDSRGGNSQYFKGRVKNVALYSDVLTPEEIKASYENGINADDENLILCYNLQGTDGREEIKDATGNGYDAHSLFFENEKPLVLGEDYAYSFAVVGDTQKLVIYDDENGTNYASYIYDWIAKNKDEKNIQFVMGLGDVTDKNRDTEWEAVVKHIKMLEDANIDYSLIQGNHDTVAKLDTYFAANPNFTGADIGYYSGTSLGNYYIRFNACDKDGNVQDQYMVVVLQYGPNNSILDWAGGVIAANPNHKVIITTHAYMYRDGTTLDINDVVPPRTPSETTAIDKDTYNNNGDQIWTKLASQYPNVVLALGGHDPYANIARRQDLGVHGNTVTQMLIDFQTADTTYNYETGMVAMFYFSADGKQVKVEYISTYNSTKQGKDVIYNATLNQFDFSIPDPVAQSDVEVTINGVGGYIVPGKYSNEVTYPFVTFKADKTFIGAYGDLGAATQAAKLKGTSGDYLVLMRRNAEQNTKSEGLAGMTGSITVDLGGYTLYKTGVGYIFDLYVNDNSSVSSLITNSDGETIDVRGTFRLNNGTVISYCKGLPLVGTNYGAKLKYTYSASIEFNNVTFIDKLDKNDKNNTDPGYNILSTWENGYTGITGDQHVEVNATFNDCIFDYKSSADGTKMIYLSNVDGYDRTVYNVKINGGNIILKTVDNLSAFVVADTTTEGRYDTVTYGKCENGNYMTVTVPTGSTLPEFDANGGELVFVKISDDATTETYRLRPALIADINYAPKMSMTLSNELVLNVYIPANNTPKFTLGGISNENLDYKTVAVEGEEYYLVSVDLGSCEAAKEIKLVATVTVDDIIATATFTFSIPKYAKKVIDSTTATDVEKTLAKDVLSYVKAAYNYFTTLNNAEEIARVNTLIDSIIGEYTGAPVRGGVTNTVSPVTAVTLNLDAKPSIRFYVTDTSVEFFVNGKKLNTVTGADSTGTYVELDVYAYALCETITYGDGSYHISDFVSGAIGTSHETLVKAFVKYVESSADYRNSIIAAD